MGAYSRIDHSVSSFFFVSQYSGTGDLKLETKWTLTWLMAQYSLLKPQ